MQSENDYFRYLKNRSRLGLIYRNHLLYPKLNKFLKGRVLDLGCGIGDFLAFNRNITGVDINTHSVKWCRSKGYKAEIMDIDKLPFLDGSFNSVIMDNVLEHIQDPIPIINEVHRTLTSGGIFLLGVPGSYGYKLDSDHKVFYSEKKLIQTIESHGFSKQKIFSMPINIKLLEKYLSQYCIYGVFKRND